MVLFDPDGFNRPPPTPSSDASWVVKVCRSLERLAARAEARAQREAPQHPVAAAALLLQRIAVASAFRGAAELVDNTDAADATAEIAEVLSAPAALRALDAVRTARQRIAYNVSPQLAVEAMLFDIQEVLRCPR